MNKKVKKLFKKTLLVKVLNLQCHCMEKRLDLYHSAIGNLSSYLTPLMTGGGLRGEEQMEVSGLIILI